MPTRSVLFALLVAGSLLVPVFGTTPGHAAPPPEPVCSVCGDELEDAAHDENTSITVTSSTVDVALRENGTARWTVHNTVDADTANYFREHPTALDALAQRAANDDPVEQPAKVTSRVADNQLIIEFVDPNAGYQSFGAVVATMFDRGPSSWTVNADSFVVYAPTGYTTFHTPSEAETNNRTVSWSGTTGEDGMLPQNGVIEPGTMLVFTPENGLPSSLRGTLAVAEAILPPLISGALLAGLLPGLIPAVVAGYLIHRRANGDGSREGPSLHWSLVILVATGAFVGFLASLLARGTMPVALRYATTIIIPASLFFALGYRDRADRIAWLLISAIALFPVAAIAVPGLIASVTASVPPTVGTYQLFVLVILLALGTGAALLVGVPAFFLGQATDRDALRSV